MPNVKRVDTLPVAFVFRVTQETHKLNAHYVSYIGMILKLCFTYKLNISWHVLHDNA